VVDLLEPRAWHEVVGHHDTGAEGLRESLDVESGSRDDPEILPGLLGSRRTPAATNATRPQAWRARSG
jgi:hypothetical protein